MLFFTLLCVLFMISFILAVYWITTKRRLDNFYQIVGCLYIMLIVNLLYSLSDKNLFSEDIWNVLFIVFSISLITLTVVYFLFYFQIVNKIRKSRLTLLVSLLISELVFLAFFTSQMNYIQLVCTIVALMIGSICVYAKLLLNKKNKMNEEAMSYYENSGTDIPLEIYFKYALEDNNSLSEMVFYLYHMAKSHRVLPKNVKNYLKNEIDIPVALKHRVEERFFELYSLSNIESISILEFANLLFPEFYSYNSRTISSDGYESRLLEDYYFMLKKNININNQQYEKLNKKLDELMTVDFLKQNENLSNNEISETEISAYAQSVVREINHCVKTPILAMKYAIKNLLNNTEELTEIQKEKLETINGNLSTIESIINGYRRLVSFCDDNIPDKITTHIATTIKALNQQYDKKVKVNIKNFVEPNITYGNNIITIMLLPLVQNAYEASPEKGTVNVECVEKDGCYIIRVENKSESKVVTDNLNSDGYSTKEKGGEGLRSVRRISASLNFDFSIKSYDSGKKVVAILKIPTNKENDINERKQIICVAD